MFINHIVMGAFTSTLPGEMLQLLAEKAKELALPKNKIIKKALRIYLEQLNRTVYVKSYKKQMAEDENLMKLAEEGIME